MILLVVKNLILNYKVDIMGNMKQNVGVFFGGGGPMINFV